MEFKHTPGPWKVHPKKTSIVIMNDYLRVEQVVNSELLPDSIMPSHLMPMADANAKLIAAAPDLIQACKTVWECLQNADDRPFERETLLRALEKAIQ